MSLTSKKIKRIASLFLILAMIFSFSTNMVVFAADPYQYKMVVDFSDGTLDSVLESTRDNVTLDTDVTFGTGESTVKWSLDSEPFVAPLLHNFRDEIKEDFKASGGDRSKSDVTVRFYSEAKGAVVTLHPCTESGKDTPSSDERVTTYSFTVGSIGWQEATVPFQSYMYSNIVTDGLKFIAESGSGDIWFDSVWFETKPSVKNPYFDVEGASVENNSGFVSETLDGNNTLSFELKNEIVDFDEENAVSVYEIGSEEVLSSQTYSVAADGNNVYVTFDEPLLSPMSYRVVLNEAAFEDERGRANAYSDVVFSVGKGSAYFTGESSIPNGSEVSSQGEFVYDIEFTSDFSIDDAYDYVSVYKNGEKIKSGVEFEKEDTTLLVVFDSLTPGAIYHITLDEDFEDLYGSKLSGETSFSFEASKSTGAIGIDHMFSSANGTATKASGTGAKSEMVTENANFYAKTNKLSFTAGENARFDIIPSNVNHDISGMNYMNCWIYNPAPSENTLMYFIGIPKFVNGVRDGQITYQAFHKLDWTGWKLISSPFSDFGNLLKDANRNTAVQVRVAFNLAGGNETVEDGYMLLDDAWLSAEPAKAPEVVASTYEDGQSGVGIFNTMYDIEFDTAIDDSLEVAVYEDSEIFDDYTKNISGNLLSLDFGTLSPLSTYTISLSNVKSKAPALLSGEDYQMSFVTSGEGIDVESITFNQDTLDTSSELKATCKLSNTSGEDVEITAYLVGYDEAGNVVYSSNQKDNLTSSETFTLTAPAGSLEDAVYVKAFATVGDMKLISDCYGFISEILSSFVLASDVKKTENADAISLETLDLKGAVLEASGVLSGVKNVLMISVEDWDGNVLMCEPVVANGTKFDYSCSFNDEFESTTLKIKVTGSGITKEAEFIYVSAEDRNELTKLANGTNEKELYEFIVENSDILEIDDLSDELISDIAMNLIENDSFDDYVDVEEHIDAFIEAFEGLSDVVWSDLADYIISNSKYLVADDKDFRKFKESSKADKNAYCKKLSKKLPVATVSEFREAFAEVIDEGIDSDDNKTVGGGSGKGSGGGSSVAVVPPKNEIPVQTTPITHVAFDDLDGFEWASESILSLNSAGIISSDAQRKFRPQDNITREEYVKLLVSLIYGNVTEVNHTFNDSVSGAWYEPYLSKAFEAGIVTGRPDGSFGVGENITREDMAVIAFRAMSISGKELSASSDITFVDKDDISDYATDAVNALSSNGIVNGVGDNQFAPKATANRAQAATIIARLKNLM